MIELKKQSGLQKLSSGIEGFDDITEGGFPRRSHDPDHGRPGLRQDRPGAPDARARREHGRPGIFVAFEENAARVAANAETFGWPLQELGEEQLFFVDASLRADVVKAGAFDLTGLARRRSRRKRAEIGAEVIVFDAIDVLLRLLDDPAAECRELYRLHEWLVRHELTGILTTKIGRRQGRRRPNATASCLSWRIAWFFSPRRVTDRVAVRSMRVVKYRGSPHVLNEVPFTIGPARAGSRLLEWRPPRAAALYRTCLDGGRALG